MEKGIHYTYSFKNAGELPQPDLLGAESSVLSGLTVLLGLDILLDKVVDRVFIAGWKVSSPIVLV
jgi:hypothetical protein